jgi:uncharacterized protein (DUF1697 family)
MTPLIALLRAVNVGGTGTVPMAELTKTLNELGCTDVRTLLQSGNVIFRTKRKPGAPLESAFEKAVSDRFNVTTLFFIRTLDEWNEAIANNPYPEAAENDPSRLIMMAFKSAPAPAKVEALRAAIVGRETVTAVGKYAYFVYPEGQGTSKLTNAIIERKLGLSGTARNWNTVLKLAAAAADHA